MESKNSLLKILVCDDDPVDRKLVRAYLQKIDSKEIVMVEAGRTAEIQKALDKGRIDLVLLDIQMPEKSGMAWLAEIAEKQTAPVVMLTGYGNEEVAVQSIQEGAVGYLPKSSLSTEKLEQVIDDAVKRWRQRQQSRATQEQLERLANIDALTGLFNRRVTLNKLTEHTKYARRYKEQFSLFMLDIDYFKNVNDRYGHIIGDDVLEQVARLIEQNVRDTDTAGRYGGDEFIVILHKADLSSTQITAERIRKTIEEAEMSDSEGNVFGITVSLGVASYEPGEDAYSLLSRADDALYMAKKNARNRVEILAYTWKS